MLSIYSSVYLSIKIRPAPAFFYSYLHVNITIYGIYLYSIQYCTIHTDNLYITHPIRRFFFRYVLSTVILRKTFV